MQCHQQVQDVVRPSPGEPGLRATLPMGRVGVLEGERLVHSERPLNRETSITALSGGVTSNAEFYVRNHFKIPLLDPGAWRLAVEGLVDHPQALTLRDLYGMGWQTRVVTLECAGNGRVGFDPPTGGVPWALGAVGTAEWTGLPLVEVLDRAGVRPTARQVIFRGADSGSVPAHARPIHYQRSLLLADARAPQVLLAYAMNGEALPVHHGYPLRLIVPGWYGMAAVKWLTQITVIGHAFAGHFQSADYYYQWSRDGQGGREPVRLQRVRSLITEPDAGAQVNAGELAIRGLAWSGAAPIARVEVSVGDAPWHDAHLLGAPDRYCWQRWQLTTAVGPGKITIRARATDLTGHTQPQAPRWNRRGYGNNAIQQIAVRVT